MLKPLKAPKKKIPKSDKDRDNIVEEIREENSGQYEKSN